MQIKFCGAAKGVTGSCHLLDNGTTKILIDCGAFQGSDEEEARNRESFPFDPAEIDYVLCTHAHFDHVGRLPLLVKKGFKGRILSTQPTRDLARVVLEDAAHIQEEELKRWDARFAGKEPNENNPRPEIMYDADDVSQTLRLFDVYPLGMSISLTKEIEVRMRDSGHILGSVSFAESSSDL